MSLLGGGDSSTTSSSGWGNPPSSGSGWGTTSTSSSAWNSTTTSTSTANHWGSRPQVNGEPESTTRAASPKPGCSSWAQAVINSGPNQSQVPTSHSNTCNNSSSVNSSRSHCDKNSMAEGQNSIFDDSHASGKDSRSAPPPLPESLFTDNWGQSVINQEQAWDLPPSPPDSKSVPEDDAYWPATVTSKSGTEIWESTVRQKNKSAGLMASASTAPVSTLPPVASHSSQNQTHWNHTPTTHIGGTWGEEEDNTSVWTGVPQTNGSSSQSVSSTSNASNGSWGTPKADEAVGGSSWKDPARGDEPASSGRSGSWGAAPSWGEAKAPAVRPTTEAVPEKLGTGGWGAEAAKPPVLPTARPSEMPGYWKKDSMSSSSGWDVDAANGDRRDSRDDGTAVWGNPERQKPRVRNWREEQEQLQLANAKMNMNSANGNNAPPISPTGSASGANGSSGLLPSSPGMIRLPPSSVPNRPSDWMKASTSQPFARPWSDGRDASSSSWGQTDVDKGRSWGDSRDGPSSPLSSWGRSKSSPSWSDGQVDTSSWAGPKQKPLTKEMILASKQFRILCDSGFKKEDAEAVLRAYNMNLEDALNELSRSKPLGNSSNTPTPSLLTPRTQPQNFPSSNSLLDGKQFNDVSCALRAASSRASGHPVPNEKQLLHLVQQIQLAVQTGHLNAQILNQPLAPQTIQLIYQLLQQIKLLQQLQNQVANSMGKNALNATPPFQASMLHVQICQTKQRIGNFQNQIAIQQALYMKQNSGSSQNQSLNDATSSLNKQSRLETTWKLPSFEKDNEADVFSRAPGGNANKPRDPSNWGATIDEASSTGGGGGAATAWSDGSDMFKDTNAPSTPFLVPEFEPGKPWKGTSQLKSIEDDPHMTPGSVNRSPLSVSFNNWSSKVSPTETTATEAMASLSLSSGTWAFPPTTSAASGFNSDVVTPKPSTGSWTSMTESTTTTTTDSSSIWSGSGSTSKPRGPPPGLSQSGLPPLKTSPGTGSPPGTTGPLTFWNEGQQSSWDAARISQGFLVLRNLTPQIDYSTLKTLCQQHGPLRLFNPIPNQGACIIQYLSQDEANKAQAALNNCNLANTTIMTHVPSESDLQQLLSISSATSSQQNWNPPSSIQNGIRSEPNFSSASVGRNEAANGPSTGSWSGLWNFPSGGNNVNDVSGLWMSMDDNAGHGSGSSRLQNLEEYLGPQGAESD